LEVQNRKARHVTPHRRHGKLWWRGGGGNQKDQAVQKMGEEDGGGSGRMSKYSGFLEQRDVFFFPEYLERQRQECMQLCL